MNLGDTQAFPSPAFESFFGERNHPPETGMTLRQYYAGLAMQGLVQGASDEILLRRTEATFAREAVRMADALLDELEKPNA